MNYDDVRTDCRPAPGLKTGDVSYEAMSLGPATARDVEAGDQYFPSDGVTLNGKCSSGFAVTFRNPFTPNPTPVRGYLTAAHCYDLATYVLRQQPLLAANQAGAARVKGRQRMIVGWPRFAQSRDYPALDALFRSDSACSDRLDSENRLRPYDRHGAVR